MASQRPVPQNESPEELQQKAREFWKEIKDLTIPDATTGKTADQIIEHILEHEKINTGIDWKAAAAAGPDSPVWKAALNKAHSHLTGLKNKLNDDEKERAKRMGILNAKGEVAPVTRLLMETDGSTANIPDGAEPYAVWGWNTNTAKKFQEATGDQIKELIMNLVANFQVMANDDTRYLVKKFSDCGLWGIGGVGLAEVWRIIRTLSALTAETEAYAIFRGILAVGEGVIKLGITTVILAVLVPFLVLMTKDAFGLMVILNDTYQDLGLEDINVTHGKVVAIFKENAELEDPKPIIPKKLPPIKNPQTGEVVSEASIQAGFLAVRKRDCALIGAQGALKFKATESFPKGAYLGWSVPLSRGSNDLLVSANFEGSVSEFSHKTGSHGKQEDTSTSSAGAKITDRVNSGSGSKAYYIINAAQ